MFGTAKKHASRIGTAKVEAVFSFNIRCLKLTRGCHIRDNAILNISFGRGRKQSVTNDFLYERASFGKETTLHVKETVELPVTIFLDAKTGKYQPKVGILQLREKRVDFFGSTSVIVIGKCTVDLHDLLDEMGHDLSAKKDGRFVFNVQYGASLEAGITITKSKELQSAVYSAGQLNQLEDDATVGGTYRTPQVITAAESTTLSELSVSEAGECTPEALTNITVAAAAAAAAKNGTGTEFLPVSSIARDSDSAEEVPSVHHNETKVSPNGTGSSVVTSAVELTNYTAGNQHGETVGLELQVRVHHLERMLQAQQESYEMQLAALRDQLDMVETALRKERVARTVMANVTQRGDDLVVNTLSQARQEASIANAECDSLAAQLHAVTIELKSLQAKVDESEADKEEAMDMSRQAATLAGMSSLRRAAAEEETDGLLYELIDTKVELAHMNLALEGLRHENMHLKKKQSK